MWPVPWWSQLGDSLAVVVARGGEKKRLVAVLQSFAHESLPNTTLDYSHVTLPTGSGSARLSLDP